MIVMPANNSGIQIGHLCGKYPGRLGWLISPGGWRKPPSWMPYALDNGAFSAWLNKREWDERAFIDLLDRTRKHIRPLWVAVPDVVADAEATKARWPEWSQRIRKIINVPLAFVVQDGMTVADVPNDADVLFVGGSTEWKWRNLKMWTAVHPRVHVGRVNSERLLWMAHDAGAESCDGTGWMRGGEERLAGLQNYLQKTTTTTKAETLLAA